MNYVVNGGPRLVARQRKRLCLETFQRAKNSNEKKASVWLLSLQILVTGGRLRFL